MATKLPLGRLRSVREARIIPHTLRQIGDVRDLIDADLEASGGELTPEIAEKLDAWGVEFDAKAERVAAYIQSQESRAEAIKAEVKQLGAYLASLTRSADGLRDYLIEEMRRTGRDKIEGAYRRLSVANNPPSVRPLRVLTEEDLRELAQAAPFAVRRVPESFSLDKEAIKEQAKVTGGLPPALAAVVELSSTPRLAIK